MASPVTVGVAAFLLEYYPTLTPQQIKYTIEKSAVVPNKEVIIPGTEKMANLSEISKTGGVINVYEAVKLAESLTAKKPQLAKVKSKVKMAKKS
jgi:subtilisin family serine protease